MAHVNRSRRYANERRRKIAEAKQRPLPIAEQQRRAAEGAALHAAYYPFAPEYGNEYARPVKRVREVAAVAPLYLELFAAHMARGMRTAANRMRSKGRAA